MIAGHRPIRSRLTALLAAASLLAAGGAVFSAQATAATCGSVVSYPGDGAIAVDYANWMANGAVALKLPGELPVMAGLVESGLRNLNYGDADSVGFFQMRTSIWNSGKYKGYLNNPELQMQWFTDTAISVRNSYIAKGKPDPAASETTYGVWIADIERPAERYRGRYQLRLKDARDLITQSCPDLAGVNVLAPSSSLKIKSKQRPAKTGAIAVRVKCPKSSCLATASAQFRLPHRRGVLKLISDTSLIAAGNQLTVKIPVPRSIRKRIRRQLVHGARSKVRLRISVAGTNGAATVRVRKMSISR